MLLAFVEVEIWALYHGEVEISFAFPYRSKNLQIANNSPLDDGNAFIFTPRLSIGNTDIS